MLELARVLLEDIFHYLLHYLQIPQEHLKNKKEIVVRKIS